MKKQKTLKLNIDLPLTSSKSHPNINLDSIPKKRGGKSLTVKCSNGAEVKIWEYKGNITVDVNEHNLKYNELLSMDTYDNYIVSEEDSHRRAYEVKRLKASTKTTQINFTTFEK